MLIEKESLTLLFAWNRGFKKIIEAGMGIQDSLSLALPQPSWVTLGDYRTGSVIPIRQGYFISNFNEKFWHLGIKMLHVEVEKKTTKKPKKLSLPWKLEKKWINWIIAVVSGWSYKSFLTWENAENLSQLWTRGSKREDLGRNCSWGKGILQGIQDLWRQGK